MRNMELVSNLSKKQRVLHITQEPEGDPNGVFMAHNVVEYTKEENDKASLIKLDLLGDAFKDDLGDTKTQTESEEEIRQEIQHVFQQLARANHELQQLVGFAQAVKSDNISMIASNKTQVHAIGPLGIGNKDQVHLLQSHFDKAQTYLRSSVLTMGTLISSRKVFYEKLMKICANKHGGGHPWRLASLPWNTRGIPGVKSEQATNLTASITEHAKIHLPLSSGYLCINSNFAAHGEELSKEVRNMVPIYMDSDGTPILSEEEKSKPILSLAVSLQYVNQKEQSCVTIYEVPSWKQSGLTKSTEEDIGEHCCRCQHDSMVRKLFSLLVGGLVPRDKRATETTDSDGGADRWVVASITTTTAGNKQKIIAALKQDYLADTLDIVELSRSALKVALSPNLYLVIRLVSSTSEDSVGPWGFAFGDQLETILAQAQQKMIAKFKQLHAREEKQLANNALLVALKKNIVDSIIRVWRE